MTQFINFEAEAELVDLDDGKEDDRVSNFSESSFIDDQAVENDADIHRQFANNVLNEAHNETLQDIEEFDEISKETKEFLKETLFQKVEEEKRKIENQFCKAILYALRYEKNGEKSICTKQDFEKVIHKDLLEQLDNPEGFKFIFNYMHF